MFNTKCYVMNYLYVLNMNFVQTKVRKKNPTFQNELKITVDCSSSSSSSSSCSSSSSSRSLFSEGSSFGIASFP